MMSDDEFLRKLSSIDDHYYDLVIVDVFPLTPCNLLLPLKLDLPFVVLSPAIFPWDMGLPSLPSFGSHIRIRLPVLTYPRLETLFGL